MPHDKPKMRAIHQAGAPMPKTHLAQSQPFAKHHEIAFADRLAKPQDPEPETD
jgi:hypothetical protein